jgi:hypothetical protein
MRCSLASQAMNNQLLRVRSICTASVVSFFSVTACDEPGDGVSVRDASRSEVDTDGFDESAPEQDGDEAVVGELSNDSSASGGRGYEPYVAPEAAGPAPFATVELENGARILFIELGAGADRAVGIAEHFPAGEQPPLDRVDLRDANPLEVFYAVADPEAEVPDVLLDLYGEDSDVGITRQGWGADDLKPRPDPLFADVACGNAAFQTFAFTDLATDLFRLDQNGTNPSLWGQYFDFSLPGDSSTCTNGSRKRYESYVYNVDQWRAATCLAQAGNHNWTCNGGFSGAVPARALYMFRDAGNNGWSIAHSFNAAANGSNTQSRWSFSGNDWDWQHRVDGVLLSGVDKVDIHTGF